MSFIDSIVGGVVDGFKTVFGLSSPEPQKAVGTVARPASQAHPTTFERSTPSTDTRTPSRSPRPSANTPIESGMGSSIADFARNAFKAAEKYVQRPSPLPGGDTSMRPPTGTGATAPAASRTPLTAGVHVFDSSSPTADGRAAYLGDATALATGGPANARVAATNVQRGLEYYHSAFGRNGVDDAGSGISIVINDRSTDASGNEIFRGNGGYYVTTDANGAENAAIRFGTGTRYQHADGGVVSQHEMQYADDLTIHELTHGVLDHETGIIGGTADEAGAVSEGLADVMAAAATRDWVIGEGMYATDSSYRAMRNIAAPTDPRAVHGLWTSTAQYRSAVTTGDAEEHYASGIVSTAAYRIQERIGGEAGWQAVESLFYAAITGGRLGSLSFGETATALRAAATQTWGAGSANARIVDEELRRGGM